MKHVIVIADGAGDKPVAELGRRTPLEAARTPNLDALARESRLGVAHTTPPGWLAGSDVCTMDLLGYDPVKYHTGRAPLEAAAIGVEAGPDDWIFRLNLVTVGEMGTPDAGLMLDHSAGAISDAEARELVAGLLKHWRQARPDEFGADQLTLTHGVSYRSILVDKSGTDYRGLKTTAPHDIPRQPWAKHLPTDADGSAKDPRAARLAMLTMLAMEYLDAHPINKKRVRAGQRPANLAWIWGQGTRPTMPSFESRFRRRGAMITAVDLLAGIARLIGWDRLDVTGVTSYHDTDYAAQGRATCEALKRYDIVCCHVESPDEASHQADWRTKVAAIEAIDEKVVGPIRKHLGTLSVGGGGEPWRLMVLPDHYTLVSTRKHDATPVPFLIAGGQRDGKPGVRFTEHHAEATGWRVDPGHTLMDVFLGSP